MFPATISVVVPSYNCEPYIGQALDSIYAQKLRPDQIIVVDDSSTDRTANLVERYCFTAHRLQSYLSFVEKILPNALAIDYRPDTKPVELLFLRQEHRGPSAARNLGIQHSRGEWLSFLDADDAWLPATLYTLLAMTQKYPQSAIVFGDGLNFTDSARVLLKLSEMLGGFPNGPIVKAFEFILKQHPILNGAVLANKEMINKTCGFREDISHGEDHDLWLKLALFTQPACTEDVVLLRRRRPCALSEDQEAFYKAEPRILSDIKKIYHAELIRQRIDIGKHIIEALYRLAYFYYSHKMPLKSAFAAMKLAIAYIGYLPNRRKHTTPRKSN